MLHMALQKKESFTGSASVINNKKLELRPISNVTKGLEGHTTGLLTTSGSGQPGEAGVAGVSPYIGENGNWFAYNTETKEVEDTGISAAGTSTYVGRMVITMNCMCITRLPGNMSQSFFLLLPLQLL